MDDSMRRISFRSPVSTRAAIVAGALVLSLAAMSTVYLVGISWGAGEGGTTSAQVSVTSASLRSADFASGGTTTTVTCGAASGSYFVLSNTGSAGAALLNVTINWGGTTNQFKVSGICPVGAGGSASATQFVLFPTSSKLSSSATAGGNY